MNFKPIGQGETQMTIEETRRIYVACLACYNEGKLEGNWVNLTEDEDPYEWCKTHETETGHEEYEAHDSDGMPHCGSSLEAAIGFNQRIVDIQTNSPYITIEQLDAYHEVFEELPESAKSFHDAYMGEWESLGDYARETAYETGEVTDETPYVNYIDWEAVGHDLGREGFAIEGGHVFSP